MKEKLSKLCVLRGLGELVGDPVPVSGGLLHRMFRVETAAGVYAVKALNPDIMQRPGALNNMLNGERVAAALEACVPAAAAVDGQVTGMDGAFYMVYRWLEGGSVFPPDITVEHCRVMGDLLGRIHAADVRIPGMLPETACRQPFDWSLTDDPCVSAWDGQVLAAQPKLLGTQVISHRDLDPKNVMWQGMTPCIIDWEAAGYVNPWQELIELLNYWADDEPKARAMIAAYGQHMNMQQADWDAALSASMDGMLGWLHYNLRRAAGLEGSAADDRRAGETQVCATLEELHRYAARVQQLREWLKM